VNFDAAARHWRVAGAVRLGCEFQEAGQRGAFGADLAPRRRAAQDLGFAAGIDFARRLSRVDVLTEEGLFPGEDDFLAGCVKDGAVGVFDGGGQGCDFSGGARPWAYLGRRKRLAVAGALFIDGKVLRGRRV
jgi:hypothetical protein